MAVTRQATHKQEHWDEQRARAQRNTQKLLENKTKTILSTRIATRANEITLLSHTNDGSGNGGGYKKRPNHQLRLERGVTAVYRRRPTNVSVRLLMHETHPSEGGSQTNTRRNFISAKQGQNTAAAAAAPAAASKARQPGSSVGRDANPCGDDTSSVIYNGAQNQKHTRLTAAAAAAAAAQKMAKRGTG